MTKDKTAEPLLEQLKGNLEKDSNLREELENKIKVCSVCQILVEELSVSQDSCTWCCRGSWYLWWMARHGY